MDQPEPNSHSFVIRIWVEETVAEAGNAVWRGYIKHVLNDNQSYIQDTSDIVAFIEPYLARMGVRTRGRWRMVYDAQRWLNRLFKRA